MDACSSETLQNAYETTRCHNLEDNYLNLNHRQTFKVCTSPPSAYMTYTGTALLVYFIISLFNGSFATLRPICYTKWNDRIIFIDLKHVKWITGIWGKPWTPSNRIASHQIRNLNPEPPGNEVVLINTLRRTSAIMGGSR